jgi:CLIP-associating protein 1/2
MNTDNVVSQSEDELEYGLIVIWEILENQAIYIEGREADIFSMLLSIRYCNKLNVSANFG